MEYLNSSKFQIGISSLNNDVLSLICRELVLVDLLNLSAVNKRLYKLIFERNDIWVYKLEQFPKYETYLKTIVKITLRETYFLLYKLIFLKNKMNITNKVNIYHLYSSKELSLELKEIKIFPKEIGILINLQTLDLTENQIKKIPKEISKLVNLENLYLSYNKIKRLPKKMCKLDKLQNLYLRNNKIKKLPKEISNLTNLKNLYLRNNKIEKLPKQLGKRKGLNIFI